MVKDNDGAEDGIGGVGSVGSTVITNFHTLCENISKLDKRITGALMIRSGKILAANMGAGSALPTDEYLSKMIREAEVMVGIPLANKQFFGAYKFTLVSYEMQDIMLFYLESQKAILGVGILPPYSLSLISKKIQGFLKNTFQPSFMRRNA